MRSDRLKLLQDVLGPAPTLGRLPPIDTWHPDAVAEIAIRIRRDGVWDYLGSPIRRPAMVRLFSTVLRKEADGRTYLVTPAEKLAITVDHAAFVAVELEARGAGRDQTVRFRTNVEDWVTADAGHPLRVQTNPQTGEPSPYVYVRFGLEALIARSVFYELANLAVPGQREMSDLLGVWSAGTFFPLGPRTIT